MRVDLGVAVDEEEIEEQAKEAVDDGQEHDPGIIPGMAAHPDRDADRRFRTPHAGWRSRRKVE